MGNHLYIVSSGEDRNWLGYGSSDDESAIEVAPPKPSRTPSRRTGKVAATAALFSKPTTQRTKIPVIEYFEEGAKLECRDCGHPRTASRHHPKSRTHGPCRKRKKHGEWDVVSKSRRRLDELIARF